MESGARHSVQRTDQIGYEKAARHAGAVSASRAVASVVTIAGTGYHPVLEWMTHLSWLFIPYYKRVGVTFLHTLNSRDGGGVAGWAGTLVVVRVLRDHDMAPAFFGYDGRPQGSPPPSRPTPVPTVQKCDAHLLQTAFSFICP